MGCGCGWHHMLPVCRRAQRTQDSELVRIADAASAGCAWHERLEPRLAMAWQVAWDVLCHVKALRLDARRPGQRLPRIMSGLVEALTSQQGDAGWEADEGWADGEEAE